MGERERINHSFTVYRCGISNLDTSCYLQLELAMSKRKEKKKRESCFAPTIRNDSLLFLHKWKKRVQKSRLRPHCFSSSKSESYTLLLSPHNSQTVSTGVKRERKGLSLPYGYTILHLSQSISNKKKLVARSMLFPNTKTPLLLLLAPHPLFICLEQTQSTPA